MPPNKIGKSVTITAIFAEIMASIGSVCCVAITMKSFPTWGDKTMGEHAEIPWLSCCDVRLESQK